MKDSRIGQSLWSIWEGLGYFEQLPNSIVYYTEDHVDLEHEIVRKALASSVQRDGIVFSLSQGFQAIDAGIVSQTWIGSYEAGEYFQEVCDEYGNTDSGARLTDVVAATFVEVPDLV
jgi:hypothetical protein